MKLAEVLAHRKALQQVVTWHQETLNHLVESGTGSYENDDPHDLLNKMQCVYDQIEALVLRTHQINAQTILPSGCTLLQGLLRRDTLSRRVEFLKSILQRMAERSRKQPWPPCRVHLQGNRLIPQLVLHQICELSKELHELDRSIDAASWCMESNPLQSSPGLPSASLRDTDQNVVVFHSQESAY